MVRPQCIIEEKSACMVTDWGRNIRANLDPLVEAGFRRPRFRLPAMPPPLSPGQKVAQLRAFLGFTNYFTKNILPSESFCAKQPVIFFTNP